MLVWISIISLILVSAFWEQQQIYHSLQEMQKPTYTGALKINSFIQSSLDKQILAECSSYASQLGFLGPLKVKKQ